MSSHSRLYTPGDGIKAAEKAADEAIAEHQEIEPAAAALSERLKRSPAMRLEVARMFVVAAQQELLWEGGGE